MVMYLSANTVLPRASQRIVVKCLIESSFEENYGEEV